MTRYPVRRVVDAMKTRIRATDLPKRAGRGSSTNGALLVEVWLLTLDCGHSTWRYPSSGRGFGGELPPRRVRCGYRDCDGGAATNMHA